MCPLQTCMTNRMDYPTKPPDKRSRSSIVVAPHAVRNRIQQRWIPRWKNTQMHALTATPSRLILGLAPLHHLLPGSFSVHPVELLVVAGVLLVDDTPRLLVNRRVDCAVGIVHRGVFLKAPMGGLPAAAPVARAAPLAFAFFLPPLTAAPFATGFALAFAAGVPPLDAASAFVFAVNLLLTAIAS